MEKEKPQLYDSAIRHTGAGTIVLTERQMDVLLAFVDGCDDGVFNTLVEIDGQTGADVVGGLYVQYAFTDTDDGSQMEREEVARSGSIEVTVYVEDGERQTTYFLDEGQRMRLLERLLTVRI